MIEEKAEKGPFGLLLPMAYEITLKRLPDGNWSLIYTEDVDPSLPEDKLKTAAEIQGKMFGQLGVQVQLEGHKFILKVQGKREALAAALVSEFLMATDFGKMTIGELMLMAGMDSIKLDALQQAAEELARQKIEEAKKQ